MELKMGQRFVQKLSQEQRLSLSERMELRFEQILLFSQDISDLISDLSLEAGASPDTIMSSAYEHMIQKLKESDEYSDQNVKELVQLLGGDLKNILLTIIQNNKSAFVLNQHTTAIAGEIHTSHRGEFEIKSGETVKIDKSKLLTALTHPDELIAEIELITDEMRNSKDVNPAQLEARRTSQNALNLATNLAPQIKEISTLLSLIKNQETIEGNTLESIVIDIILFEEMLRQGIPGTKIAERLTKKMLQAVNITEIKRFESTKTVKEHMKTIITNEIAHIILASFGIISKDIFVKMRGDQPVVDKDLDSAFKHASGKSLTDVATHFGLKTDASFFFTRYSTLQTKPNRKTDEQIRHFITEVVRADQDVLIEAMGLANALPMLYEEIKTLAKDEDKQTAITRFLKEQFANRKFREILTSKIKTDYKEKMDQIIS